MIVWGVAGLSDGCSQARYFLFKFQILFIYSPRPHVLPMMHSSFILILLYLILLYLLAKATRDAHDPFLFVFILLF